MQEILRVWKKHCSFGTRTRCNKRQRNTSSSGKSDRSRVGAFGDAMGKMHQYGLVEVLREIAAKGTPLLGICLGLQLFFESSEETPGVEGLGLLPGKIVRIPDKRRL